MLLQAPSSQLLLIDYQQRLMPAMHEGAAVIANAERLARAAQLLQVPLWATEQSPEKLGPTVAPLAGLAARIISKTSFSAAQDLLPLLAPAPPSPPTQASGNARSLPKHLRREPALVPEPRAQLVLAGCEAHVCLLQTALTLLELEFEVYVVTDASSSRSERNRDAAFDRLASAGADLLSTEMVLFEWLESAQHPQFKTVQALIK